MPSNPASCVVGVLRRGGADDTERVILMGRSGPTIKKPEAASSGFFRARPSMPNRHAVGGGDIAAGGIAELRYQELRGL